jgi:glycosyltransferase involved in cell wall biosynthesis
LVKVIYIISNINKAFAFEWIAQYLPKNNFQLSFILLNPGNSTLAIILERYNVKVINIKYHGKADFFSSLWKLASLFIKIKPDVIHCHMFDASITGLLAGKITGVKNRIYTRHHSTSNWIYNKKGLKYDKILNYTATKIIATSENVKKVLKAKENTVEEKIHVIHHGFDLNAFKHPISEHLNELSSKYNPNSRFPVIGIIARWMELKGIQYIIPAFKKLLPIYPDALLILANANGPYKHQILSLLRELPEDSYLTISFEPDLFSLYQLFDIYVHTPIDSEIEAFGQTYVEALAAGIPSVFTLSGVAHEFIEHEKNALVVDYKNTDQIYSSLLRLLSDADLSRRIRNQGQKDVQKQFQLQTMIRKLEDLYLANEQ